MGMCRWIYGVALNNELQPDVFSYLGTWAELIVHEWIGNKILASRDLEMGRIEVKPFYLELNKWVMLFYELALWGRYISDQKSDRDGIYDHGRRIGHSGVEALWAVGKYPAKIDLSSSRVGKRITEM